MIMSEKKITCSSPKIVFDLIKSIEKTYDEHEKEKEHFYCIGLNNKNVIQYVDLISIGTVSETIVHPREVLRYAIIKNVSNIILAHNHPSGNTTPSAEDIATTERLKNSCVIIGIKLLDHVIVGDEYLSMKENNYLQ